MKAMHLDHTGAIITEVVGQDVFDRLSTFKGFKNANTLAERQNEIQQALAQAEHDESRTGIKKRSIRYFADKAGLITEYDITFRHLCGSTHVSIRNLEQQYVIKSDDGASLAGLQFGPDYDLKLILHTLIESMGMILAIVDDELHLNCDDKLNDLHARLQLLNPEIVKK